MLIKVKLLPEGEMLVNPEAVQWVKPEINTAYEDSPNPGKAPRVRFLVKNGKSAFEDEDFLAPYSLTDFHDLMKSGNFPDDM